MKKIKAIPMAPEPAENDHEARQHLNTILEAHGIMGDKGKMEKVHKLAGRHHKAITSIKGLKDHYNDKFGAKKKSFVIDDDADGE